MSAGLVWVDLGVIATASVDSIASLENGIAIFGDHNGHVFRSIDYGLTWTDLGDIAGLGEDINATAYLGNGVVIMGDHAYHIYRSIDYGLTWADLGQIVFGNTHAMASLGGGIAIIADFGSGVNFGHVRRSIDYGLNWVDLGVICNGFNIRDAAYLGNGVALLVGSGKNVYRSIDYGLNWVDLGVIATATLYEVASLGGGIAICGGFDDHLYRSIDYGLNWVDLGVIATDPIKTIESMGNGVAIVSDDDGYIFRSVDYGLTWTNLGVIAVWSRSGAYLGNNTAVIGNWGGHIFRSAVPSVITNDAINNTLKGQLDDDGGALCDCGFEWGTDPALLTHSTVTTSQNTGDTFNQTLNLWPGTYYFRAFATNLAGTAYGAVKRFIIPSSGSGGSGAGGSSAGLSASVGTLSAINITENAARLRGMVNDSLFRYGMVRFEYGLTTSYGQHTPWQDGFISGNEFHADITNLSEGSAYHFRAQMKINPIISGTDSGFTTLSPVGPTTWITDDLMQLVSKVS